MAHAGIKFVAILLPYLPSAVFMPGWGQGGGRGNLAHANTGLCPPVYFGVLRQSLTSLHSLALKVQLSFLSQSSQMLLQACTTQAKFVLFFSAGD